MTENCAMCSAMLADFENDKSGDLEDIVLPWCRLYFSHGLTIFLIGNSCRRSADFENYKSEDLEDIVLPGCRPQVMNVLGDESLR